MSYGIGCLLVGFGMLLGIAVGRLWRSAIIVELEQELKFARADRHAAMAAVTRLGRALR